MLIPGVMPACFATYEHGNEICDGNPKHEEEHMRCPCGVLAVCRVVSRKVEEESIDRASFLRFEFEGDRVVRAIPNTTVVRSIVESSRDIVVPVPPPIEIEAIPQEPNRIRWKRSFEWRWLYKHSPKYVEHWRRMLLAQFPWSDLNVPPRAVLPGQIVEIDEGTKRGRLTYRMKLAAPRPGYNTKQIRENVYLGRIRIFRQKDHVDIELPVTMRQLEDGLISARMRPKLHAHRTYSNYSGEAGKQFGIICTHLDLEGVALAAEVVGAAAKNWILDLSTVIPERSKPCRSPTA